MNDKLANLAPVARILLALMFIISGLQKISGYEGTQGYMEFMGVPGALLPIVIVLEVVAGIGLLIGFQARISAILLAGFTIVAGTLFHLVPSFGMEGMAAQNEVIHFMKNLSITGGLLLVVTFGAGAFSVDNRRSGSVVPAE
ncbi:MAG: DoxX family protein [Yoonia sp.]|uniref:DoxX family protein n=1 Tax=Yoonia sp. TaxID=2212373 RepID=UPI003EF339DB